jgi:hypothetical protein
MNIKEYGVKKTWDGWRSYALVKDYGNYVTPITWLNKLFKTKKKAKNFIEKEINKLK